MLNKDILRIVWMTERFPQNHSKKLEQRFQRSIIENNYWRTEQERTAFLNGYHKHITAIGGWRLP